MKNKYNLTEADFEVIWTLQGGCCGICLKPLQRDKFTHIDHDWRCCPGRRSCGKCVRGLLCFQCNTGRFRDDPALLRRAADWFEFGGIFRKPRRPGPVEGGHVRQRGKSWEVRVFAGTDPKTSRKRYITRTAYSEEEAETLRQRLLGMVGK